MPPRRRHYERFNTLCTGRLYRCSNEPLVRTENLAGVARDGRDLLGAQFLRECGHGALAVGDQRDLIVDVRVLHCNNACQFGAIATLPRSPMTTCAILRINLLALNKGGVAGRSGG